MTGLASKADLAMAGSRCDKAGMSPFSVHCAPPLLVVTFDEPQAMLSWSLTRPGFVTASSIAWLRVSEADLPIGGDPATLLTTRVNAAGYVDAVPMMTSRDVSKHHLAHAEAGTAHAACLATVGLANAGRIGSGARSTEPLGTINIMVHVDCPLSTAAMVEALSIATEARTAAVIDLGWRVDGEIVTGTGTDCIVLASPQRADGASYAGLHTDIGAAIGRAVYSAVKDGGEEWIAERSSR